MQKFLSFIFGVPFFLLLNYCCPLSACSTSPHEELAVAASDGIFSRVREALAKGASPDLSWAGEVKSAAGRKPAVVLAAQHNEPAILEIIMKAGADVKLSVEGGEFHRSNALHWAACGGSEQNARRLLEAGLTSDLAMGNGLTPLMFAIQCARGSEHKERSYEAVIQLLMKHDPLVSLATSEGFTPLHFAAKYDTAYLAELLLRNRPNTDLRDNQGNTPLMTAAGNGSTMTALALVASNQVDIFATRFGDGADASQIATKSGYPELGASLRMAMERRMTFMVPTKALATPGEMGASTLMGAAGGMAELAVPLLSFYRGIPGGPPIPEIGSPSA
jgi:hypothetical protein